MTLVGVHGARTPRATAGSPWPRLPLRDEMIGDTRTPLLILMASAALVLIIDLREPDRRAGRAHALAATEFAVRTAIGAGRGRMIRQLLTESLLLASGGGVAGVLLAWWLVLRGGSRAGRCRTMRLWRWILAAPLFVLRLLSPWGWPSGWRRRLLRRVIRTVCCGIPGGAPATADAPVVCAGCWSAARSRSGQPARRRRVARPEPLGDDSGAARLRGGRRSDRDDSMPGAKYATHAARMEFQARFAERLRAMPGVASVAAVSSCPLRSGTEQFAIEGAAWPEGVQPSSPSTGLGRLFPYTAYPAPAGTYVGPNVGNAPPVVVISESMAKRFGRRQRGSARGFASV